jgi:hypothetical protein
MNIQIWMKFPVNIEFLVRNGNEGVPRISYQPRTQDLMSRCAESDSKLSLEQVSVVLTCLEPDCYHIKRAKRVVVVSGAAGTGKTAVIKAIKSRLGEAMIVCPNNIQAASLLGQTAHKILGCTPSKVPEDAEKFRDLEDKRVVIIDESQQLPANVSLVDERAL